MESTGAKIIVEDSRRNDFWGAVRDKSNENSLNGSNVLGQLLIEVRQYYLQNKDNSKCCIVEPLKIPDFRFIGQDIETITVKPIHL